MTRISVIIPAWNAAATIAETLASVTRQTRQPHEILVVDDGSTDATREIAGQAPGVRIIGIEHAGVAAALNAGLAAAQGAFISFLDADDRWMPQCLEVHAAQLETDDGRDASVGWVREFVCPSLAPEVAARFQPRPAQAGWLAGATMLRREALERAGRFDPALQLGAWIDWVDRARRAGVRFDVVDAVVLERRLRPGSLSTRKQARDAAMIDVARRALLRRRQAP